MVSEKSTTPEEKYTGNLELVSQVDLPYYSDEPKTKWQEFKDGFKRLEKLHEEGQLVQGISKRHLQVMAISTGTGTGLLVAALSKLASAGPAGLLVAYAVLGYIMLIPMVNCLSEIAIAYPGLPGGFQLYSAKFIDDSLGAALGWNYYLNWLVVIPLEIVTATMTIKYWTTTINPDAWVPIFIVVVLLLNISSRVYGEAEYFFNLCKVLMVSGFIIFGICVTCGASPSGFIGGKYYHDPGAWGNGFRGFCTTFAAGAFSLGGSEFISLSAAEVKNPTRAIKSASKFTWFKVTVLFLGSLCMIGLLVPSNDPHLLNSGSAATSASPYVLAASLHGIKVLPSIINAVILISVTSVGTAAFYSTCRLLHSLAEQGLAPKWFDYVDRKGRPLRAMIVSTLAMFFAFIAEYENETAVFNWMLSISALSFIILWFFVGIIFLRWRQALKYNNIPLLSLAYRSPTGIYGAILCLVINFAILLAQFWTGLWPKNGHDVDIANFFQAYLGVIFFLVLWVAHKLYSQGWRFWTWRLWKPLSEIEIDKGRVVYDPEVLELEKLEAKEKFKRAPFWKKAYIIIFD